MTHHDENFKTSEHPALNYGAIFMIILGLLFFLTNFGMIGGRSIGLFFAAVPAFWVSLDAWRLYQKRRTFSRELIMRLMWALFPFAVLAFIYLDYNIGLLWPLVLIFIGITMFIGKGPE